jgi:hypothetical protein
MRAPSSSLTLSIWGACFEPVEGQAPNPSSVGPLRGGSWVPSTFCIFRTRGLAAGPALKPLISSLCKLRAPVAPAPAERVSRPLVGNCTLRGSGFFEPRTRAARWSSLLGKGPGHLMPTVAATYMRSGRAFSGAAAARVVGDVGGRT